MKSLNNYQVMPTTTPHTNERKRDKRRSELAVIHLLKKDFVAAGHLTEEQYRWIVAGILDSRSLQSTRDHASAADLDAKGRGELIDTLKNLTQPGTEHGNRRARGRYLGTGSRGEGVHLTQDQADYISGMEDELGWATDPTRLHRFIERQIGVKSTVNMLGRDHATKVITGLERMTGRSLHPRSKARA